MKADMTSGIRGECGVSMKGYLEVKALKTAKNRIQYEKFDFIVQKPHFAINFQAKQPFIKLLMCVSFNFHWHIKLNQ